MTATSTKVQSSALPPLTVAGRDRMVREELAKHRGTQFDPAICDMLLASPQFARIFDPSDSGQAIRLTGMFPAVRKRIRTPAAA
jgi:hypothetical protein